MTEDKLGVGAELAGQEPKTFTSGKGAGTTDQGDETPRIPTPPKVESIIDINKFKPENLESKEINDIIKGPEQLKDVSSIKK